MRFLNPQTRYLLALGLPAVPCNDSGGGGGNTTSTNTTTNIPEYARPYFEDLMNQTQATANQGYVPYGGTRVAGPNAAQNTAANMIGNATEPSQIQDATNMTGAAAQGLSGLASYSTPYIGSMYNPQATQMYRPPQQSQMYQAPQQSQMFNAPDATHSNYQAGDFTGDAVAKYMSPYQQNVIDTAKRESNNQFAQQNVGRDAQAASQGTFGGDRAALVKQEAQRGQNQQLDAIQSSGDQAAYNAAMAQFNANQGQQQVANQQGLGAQTFNAQQQMAYGQAGNANQQFNAQLQQAYGQAGNQNQQFNAQQQQTYGQNTMQNQQYNESQRQQAANLGLQGQVANANAQQGAAGVQQAAYSGLGAMGNQMGNLGQTQQNLYLQRASALNQVGTQQQQTSQTALDAAYQDFVNQRDYPKSQLNFYSGILHGQNVTPNSDVQSTSPAPSNLASLAGLGIAGAGAYNEYAKQ